MSSANAGIPRDRGLPDNIDPFIRKLHEARRAQRITQKAIASRIGCHVNMLNNWERGRHAPRLPFLLAWMKELGIGTVFPELPEVTDELPVYSRKRADPVRLGFIATAIAIGQNYTQISKDLGITRERVRQIVKKNGIEPCDKSWVKSHARMVARQEQERLDKEAKIEARRQFFAPLIDRVRNGESLWAVSGHNKALQNMLGIECARVGVMSQAHSRWRPAGPAYKSPRPVKPPRVKIARERLAVEAKRLPRVPSPTKSELRDGATVFSPYDPDIIAQICSLKGERSASIVAKELGLVSRNAVIGIWYRHHSAALDYSI